MDFDAWQAETEELGQVSSAVLAGLVKNPLSFCFLCLVLACLRLFIMPGNSAPPAGSALRLITSLTFSFSLI